MFKQQQPEMTHTRMVRSELGQSFTHAMRAANHAATGISGTFGERMMPMAERMRTGAMQRMGDSGMARRNGGGRARMMADLAQSQMKSQLKRRRKQQARQRRGRMITMLAGGVAVGSIAAFIMRRRRQREWEEYEANVAMERSDLAEAGIVPPGSTGMTAGGTGQPAERQSPSSDIGR